MRNVGTLLRLELRSLFGINKLRHTRDKREKSRGRLLAGVWVFLLVGLMGYIAGYVVGLSHLGLGDAVPLYLAVMAAFVIFVFGLFKAGSTLFGQAGYDLLASMPLSGREMVISRLLRLYIEDLLFSLAILLPGVVTYGILCRPAGGFYSVAAVGWLLLPLIPLVASAAIGTCIWAVSVRTRHKALIQSILLVTVAVALAMATFAMTNVSGTVDGDFIADLLSRASALLGRLYPPAVWLSDALLGVSRNGLLYFALASIGAAALGVLLCIGLFSRIMRGLGAVRARHDDKVLATQASTLPAALYKREMKRYFASSMYVTNTIIGPVLAVIASGVLCVTGTESMESALPAALPLGTLLPLALSAILCMMPPSSVAISMEGKQIETVKSLPIPMNVWLSGKMLWSLTLILPAWLVSEVLLTIALRPHPAALLGQWLAPLGLILFTVVLGLSINLRFHSFDWEREEVPVKQSLPAMLGGFAGLLLSLGACGMILLVPATYRDGALIALALLFSVAAWLLHRRNGRVAMETL